MYQKNFSGTNRRLRGKSTFSGTRAKEGRLEEKELIFLAGLHRSGTSLLHQIIRSHPEVSGFSDTGVPEDEGQHLQAVYEPASSFGGPGKFAFDRRSYMDESHVLATRKNAKKIFDQWRKHLDLSCKYLVEKSPPNIVRSRFFQKLFPGSKFIFILRHPLAVSYATREWSRTSIHSLFQHYLIAHAVMLRDMQFLDSVHVLRYEELVAEPQTVIDGIFSYLGLASLKVDHDVRQSANDKYYRIWESDRRTPTTPELKDLPKEFESKINKLGYSINDYHQLTPVPWLGTAN